MLNHILAKHGAQYNYKPSWTLLHLNRLSPTAQMVNTINYKLISLIAQWQAYTDTIQLFHSITVMKRYYAINILSLVKFYLLASIHISSLFLILNVRSDIKLV